MHHRPRLSTYTREAIVEEIKEGTPVARVAKNFHVSRTTVYRWRVPPGGAPGPQRPLV